ncbi:DUF3499 domain-containing protein [soil metagenome]
MSLARRCSRTPCGRQAVQTLTYVYADQIAVLGPLATYAEPHAYDLCSLHGERLSAPRGWEVLRLASDVSDRGPSSDDLIALADAVREAGRPAMATQGTGTGSVQGERPAQSERSAPADETGRETSRKGHLRMLTTD